MESKSQENIYRKHELYHYDIKSNQPLVVSELPLYNYTFGLHEEVINEAIAYGVLYEVRLFIQSNIDKIDLLNNDPQIIHSFIDTGYKRVLVSNGGARILLPTTWAQLNYNVYAEIEVQKRALAEGVIFGTGTWSVDTLLLHNSTGMGHVYYNRSRTPIGLPCRGMGLIDYMYLAPTSATINGVLYETSGGSNTGNGTVQMKLFGSDQTSYYSEVGISKLFYGNGNTTDYKLIPHIDSNNKPCMLDLNTGLKYYNCSGGYFTTEIVKK